MSTKPKLLAQPGKIGTMQLKNRLVIPAMCTNYTFQGHFTDRAVYYYGLRAKGGAGLIIIEASAIDYPIGRSVLNCAVSDDGFIPTLRKLTDEVHKYDTKIALQIMHSGRQTSVAICGSQPVSCSPAASAQVLYDEPRALTLYECKEMVKKFGEGARRAKEGGFDAVELHYAHGYLMSAFLSPTLNTRTDEYGGLEGGLKLACEVVEEVKRRCGSDYPVLVRINGDDYYPAGGVTHIDSRMISVALEKAGVDCINISSGLRESDHNLHDQTMASPRGSWVYMAEGIKKTVDIPVMVAKRISEDMVERILQEGRTDFVCIGRPHITDPEYGNKLLDGRADEILPCIWCAQGCFDVLWMLAPTTCLVNPAAGRTDESPIDALQRAPEKKKVAVVGAGPAGCKAALVAARRGHEVTLYEREKRLGGAYRLATPSPSKAEVERLFDYFERALPKAGVQMKLGVEFTPDMAGSGKTDAVILAVGASPLLPEKIPGTSGANVVTAEDVMAGKAAVGDRVAIWTCSFHCRYTCKPRVKPVEGDPTGVNSSFSYACRAGYGAVDTAEYLASQGKLVSIVTEREGVVPGMGYTSRGYLIKRFYRANIRVCDNVKVKEINDRGMVLEKAGHDFLLDADTVVVSVGARSSRKEIQDALEGKVKEVYAVGDCDKVGNAMSSIASAYDVAMRI
ncbi:MAG: FAD-dependent oxidoreductase [Deltaproteobacteria bacterium]|nr:FAD-dependent oxidoreductase [Deltaproteobacteria bacterium]MBW2137221.1 FAD-dependent oxidoreductase [Deltaproteobacteria bacterium]